jgi:tagaturonate epimerase
MILEKYSLGIGDRFGMEGVAQLRALQAAKEQGVLVVPVWNKSNREHTIIGTQPQDTLRAVTAAVATASWIDPFYLDADHIGLATLENFIGACNFFTLDVADLIGKPAPREDGERFLMAMAGFKGTLRIPGMGAPVIVDDTLLRSVVSKYLGAVTEAGRIYRSIASRVNEKTFVAEMSLDEADLPQTPAELFFILAAVAREGIPLQTIAPKFTGDFLKGIDYVGDISAFERDFRDDLAVVRHASTLFGLPANLKLSVHTGSDKFSLYPLMRKALRDHDAGLHLKTAGTTWLEEVIGIAATGGEGLRFVQELYGLALARYDELLRPYLTVVRIDRSRLPAPAEVQRWTAEQFVESLRHDQAALRYSTDLRQFLHVSFRIAAEAGEGYMNMLRRCRGAIERNVTTNLYDRHIKPLFIG